MEIYDLKTMALVDVDFDTIVALGTFDGCHFAHQRVLSSAFYEAKRRGVKSLVYTFYQTPKADKGVKSIYTLEEKIKAFKKAGLDYVAIEHFERIKNMSAREFFDNVLVGELKAVGASCGYNYKFGKGASACADDLTSFFGEIDGGSVQICEKVVVDEKTISSTLLRSLLENGEVENLYSFGSSFSVYSKVLHGKRLGRELGFPTINQKIPDEKVIPKSGVYITECEIGEDVYPSITNVGMRPSVDDGDDINMETHIIGYDGVLYHSYIRVNFYKFLREERAFASLDELRAQIGIDTEKSKAYFK